MCLVTSQGRLLTFGFYSFSPSSKFGPNNGQGLGRVVREIQADGTYGPIYFIRYNRHAGWNESNTRYPCYRQSPARYAPQPFSDGRYDRRGWARVRRHDRARG